MCKIKVKVYREFLAIVMLIWEWMTPRRWMVGVIVFIDGVFFIPEPLGKRKLCFCGESAFRRESKK